MSYNDDELISAYVDGQLSEPERTAIESRLHGDTALRRRLMATQLLTREARQLESMPAPRNFILPRDIATARKPEYARSSYPMSLFRLGSIAAALFFVFFVGLDVLQSSLRTTTQMATPAPAVLSAPALPTVAGLAGNVAVVASVSPAQPNADLVTAAPMATVADMLATEPPSAAAGVSKSAARAPAMSVQSTNGDAARTATLALTATPQPLQEAALTSAPAPTLIVASSPAPSPVPTAMESAPPASPLITLPRVLAAIALALAIGLGIFGWTHRE